MKLLHLFFLLLALIGVVYSADVDFAPGSHATGFGGGGSGSGGGPPRRPGNPSGHKGPVSCSTPSWLTSPQAYIVRKGSA